MKRVAIVALAAGFIGCQGDRSLTPPGPSALIRDAHHNDGNAFFFWLPPVVKQQAPSTQVFSGGLRPVITIRALCSDAIIRTFSGADVQVSNAHYVATWHTDQDNLDPTCTYRMTVSVGANELGFADVDVVAGGSGLRNVNTDEFIPLLDGRTLPISFFIGVGSLCRQDAGVDCGEGTARPGENTTIVTTNGRAGVFVPAGAVDQEVTIIIESIDERPCIVGLPEPKFEGTMGAAGNSCYDFRTDPPLSRINEEGRFNTNVTVGICVEFGDLDEVSADLLQIFQFDPGTPVRALPNVPAPFLPCDPGFTPSFGSLRTGLYDLAVRGIRSLLGPVAMLAAAPRPLSASTVAVFNLGAGGSTPAFSRFTWALLSEVTIDFDQAVDGSAVAPGTAVNSLYSTLGVRFSRTNPAGLCAGTAVYANDHGPGGFGSGQNNVTVCPEGTASDFSDDEFGAIVAQFALPAVQACIGVTPLGDRGEGSGTGYIEALDANGEVLDRTESTTSGTQTICVSAEEIGIVSVRFAGTGAGFAIFDNLFWARTLPIIE